MSVAGVSHSTSIENRITYMAQTDDIGGRQQAHDDEPHVRYEFDRPNKLPWLAIVTSVSRHGQGRTCPTTKIFRAVNRAVSGPFLRYRFCAVPRGKGGNRPVLTVVVKFASITPYYYY